MMALAAIVVSISLSLAWRLEVVPGFEALLPENRDSVRELNRVKEHTKGVSSIFVVLEGDDTPALRGAADAIVTEVAKIERPWVGAVESGLHQARRFLEPRAGLYASTEQLEQLRDDVNERYQYEIHKQSGSLLDEDEDDQPPEINVESLKKRFGVGNVDADRYPDGYYQSKDGKAVIVSIRSGVLGTDHHDANEAIGRVRAAIAKVGLSSFHPSIRYGLTGDLISTNAEYTAITDDLSEVGILGATLIISVVFLYYLRMRTLLSMLLTIGIGVSVSFGMTELLIGQLNVATGFLFTIIAGNGINPGIIYMARYLEARRKGTGTAAAIRRAHRDTWLPTLTASCAASAAYASLLVSDFLGFRDFGIIGSFGMVLCWICTFIFLPSILVIADRIAPLERTKSGLFGLLPKATAGGTRFGLPFAALVSRAPRTATIIGVAVTVLATVATVRWVQNDPMEYDLTSLRSDMSEREEEVRLSKMAEDITGFVGYDGMAILAERVEQVPLLLSALGAVRAKAPADEKPFATVHTLQDFVPGAQAAKKPFLMEIKDKVLRTRKLGALSDEDFAKLQRYLPPDDLQPFGIDDLPEDMARPFTERDGTRGRIVYISPTDVKLIDDAHYLFRWADSYRRTTLSDGSVILGSGRAVIYADIWESIVDDVPKAVVVALLATMLVVAFAFRRIVPATAVMIALVAGVAWMTGLLAVFGVKLNSLNFIALPITFGIGVDYAVNIMQRYRHEGVGGALNAVRETGGAVILCSLTTTFGYLALVRSVNYSVRSLGIAAFLGEVACLLAAVIILPSALMWRDGSRRRKQLGGGSPDGPPSSGKLGALSGR